MEELVRKILAFREKAMRATGDERVEFTMLNEHYFIELLRGLPFLLCPYSKLKGDIILWNDDTKEIQTTGPDGGGST